MEKRVKKADWLLLVGILAIALVAMGLLWLCADKGAAVQVTVDGEVVAILPLGVDTTYPMAGNTLVIADGTAYMRAADCPDGLCVAHRPISRAGESIICLPHRVVVTVVGNTPVVDGEV